MPLFSQRKGIKPVKSVMQVDGMDEDLRNSLWNAVTIVYWNQVRDNYAPAEPYIKHLLESLWQDYFKKPLDTIAILFFPNKETVKKYFFECKWYEVYDFIEFIANKTDNKTFTDYCNSTLERELSAYRFVGGKITQITSEAEIAEIEEALETPFKPVNEHLNRALDLLADRKSPDYRNPIKESISAVEALCKLVTNNPNATLGDALDIMERENKVKIHPALKRAFDSMYGYTSTAEGIRHGLSDEPNLCFEDAKFMLVSCSGFVNYLVAKSSKAGIALGK